MPVCPPGRASRRFATIKVPFLPRPQPELHSTLLPYFVTAPTLSVTGWAAQSSKFSPCDVVGLTWSPLGIPPPSGLAALIRSFLEPNFPRRWSASNVDVDA